MGNASWSEEDGNNPFVDLMDAECFVEKQKQPRINKEDRYANKENRYPFHAFFWEDRQKQGLGGILRRQRLDEI